MNGTQAQSTSSPRAGERSLSPSSRAAGTPLALRFPRRHEPPAAHPRARGPSARSRRRIFSPTNARPSFPGDVREPSPQTKALHALETLLNHDTRILRYAEERGITRLVHFTRAHSLSRILDDGMIRSTRRLLLEHRSPARNDFQRLDNHRDFICCSIQVPNVYVLNDYSQRFRDTSWVILFLEPEALGRPTTRFSPVNAATAGGKHVQEGFEGFRSLFEKEAPGPRAITRAEHHRPNCPTDIQAEVLVKDAIPTSSIARVFVNKECVRRKIAPRLAGLRLQPEDQPALFEKRNVESWVRYDRRQSQGADG